MVLQKLCTIFKERLRGQGYLIRTGGDEFALLLSQDNPEVFIEQCLNELRADPELLNDEEHEGVHVSIGIAAISRQRPVSLDAIYREADEALYRSKRQSRQPTSLNGK